MHTKNIGSAVSRRSNDLPVIVAINEEIKIIINIASEINLAAVNAMLISKKMGASSSGFGVVSSELRAFSARLGGAMGVLLDGISMLVREMAGLIRLDKMMRLHRSAHDISVEYTHIAPLLKRKEQEFEHRMAKISEDRESLSLSVSRANKLCVMGKSIAYSAKIEAVYGAQQASALKQVSEEVEEAIGVILGTLKKLELELGSIA